MKISVQGHDLYAYTGGKEFNPAQPTAVFIHGVLNDHSVWILQTRYLAHHGWNVLAIDLPGHCKSEGAPPQSVEEAVDTVIALLDALKVEKATLIGHSFGSLIALEATARDAAAHPGRVSHLVMVGTAYPMRVSPALLGLALSDPLKAIEKITRYSHAPSTDAAIVQASEFLRQVPGGGKAPGIVFWLAGRVEHERGGDALLFPGSDGGFANRRAKDQSVPARRPPARRRPGRCHAAGAGSVFAEAQPDRVAPKAQGTWGLGL